MKNANMIRMVAVLLGFACTGVASAQLPPPPPEIARPVGNEGLLKFDEETFSFGDIWDHKKVTHEFTFTNTGKEALNITDVKSSCGCTVPSLTKTQYAPGESGKITVIFNPENRSGQQHKVITVTTDSKITPTVRVAFTANVSKVLDIKPPVANVGRIFKNEEKGIKIHIIGRTPDFKAWPAEKQPEESSLFHVKSVETMDTQVDGQTRRETIVRVWVEEGVPVGRHSAGLIIKTNDPRRPELELRSIVTVVGDLQGRPPRFALGRLEPGQDYEQTVRLVNRVADPFKITSIDSTGEVRNLDITFAPVEEGKYDAYEITVHGVAPKENERILGRILVHTDMPEEPTVELPIYGFVNSTKKPAPNAANKPANAPMAHPAGKPIRQLAPRKKKDGSGG